MSLGTPLIFGSPFVYILQVIYTFVHTGGICLFAQNKLQLLVVTIAACSWLLIDIYQLAALFFIASFYNIALKFGINLIYIVAAEFAFGVALIVIIATLFFIALFYNIALKLVETPIFIAFSSLVAELSLDYQDINQGIDE